MWFERHPLWTALVGALIIHGAVVGVALARWGQLDVHAFSSLDCQEYYALAMGISENGRFTRDGRPETWRTPGYPAFLAVFIRAGIRQPTGLILIQLALGVINTLLLTHILCRLAGPRRALLASGLFLIEPYHHFYAFWLLSTTLFTTCILLLWMAWLSAQRRPAVAFHAPLGLLAGATILVRPLAMLLPLALALSTLLTHGRRSRAGNAGAALVLLAASGLIPGGWALRNRAVGGHLALSSQGGVVLAYFKAAEVRLWREGRAADRYIETSLDPRRADAAHSAWDAIDASLRAEFSDFHSAERQRLSWPFLAQGNRTDVNDFEVSAALRRVGIRELLSAPAATAACCVSRCVTLLTTPLNLALCNYAGVSANRARDWMLGAAYAGLLAWVVWRLLWRLDRQAALFPVAGLIALLLTSTPQLDPRLRVPMIPLLAALAVLPLGNRVKPVPTHDAAQPDSTSSPVPS